MKKYPKLTDFYPIIDKSILDDEDDTIYIFIVGPRCTGRKLAERLYAAYREVLNDEKA